MSESATATVIEFLIAEVRLARERSISPGDEVLMHILNHRAERRTRRLERIAAALAKLDAETSPAPPSA